MHRHRLPRLAPRALALLVAGAAALLAGGVAGAQQQRPEASADTAELARRLEQSLELIKALTARVNALEAQLGVKAAPPAPATAPPAPAAAPPAEASTAARLQAVEATVSQLAADSARETRDASGVPLHGFADVQGVGVRRPLPGQQKGFAVGTLDFYLTPELGDHVKTLVELNFGVGSDGDTEVDIERMQIGYAFNDALTLWLGRFHTPFGYWNMAFHHGAQIQPTILRPRMLDFEDDGGFLPVHTTGLWATGATRLGGDRLSYHAYVGNGTRISGGQLNPNPSGDDNGNKVLGVAASNRFSGRLDGLTLGLNALTQQVDARDANGAPASRTRLRVLGSYAAYESDNWELIGEGYLFRNRSLDGDGSGGSGTHNSWSAYAQVGRSFNDRWVPYYRLERASLNAADNYFASLDSGRFAKRHVLGVRYNADPRAAVKLEFNRTVERGTGSGIDELRLQYAIGF
jgi:hypothetical protein